MAADRIQYRVSLDDRAPGLRRSSLLRCVLQAQPYPRYQNLKHPRIGLFLPQQSAPCFLPPQGKVYLQSSGTDTYQDNQSQDVSVNAQGNSGCGYDRHLMEVPLTPETESFCHSF